ncbi:MAG: outer membrane beta-barrel protein [Bacteroidales bacterium]|nr:outer membrane beta-barrel protein [Bacteroidales bacterium]
MSAILFFGAAAFAQNTVKVALQDSQSGEAVSFATVSLTKKGASKPSKYVLSDDHGKAVIEKVSAATYEIKAELLGYKAYSAEIEVKGDVDLGVFKMVPDREVLDAASVTATGNPIVVKKDTIEYNASSFKTTDNDMLEDLLKKLPGVEVSEDGTVTANGQTINKITIDGKTFFLDDPQLATKNIPAKVIEKVKVLEKKSEQAEFTGISDGNEETVIDLSIRPGMMNGLFGNVMLGGGHDIPSKESREKYGNGDWRFQGAGFAGRFSEKNQISVILNGNNTNNRGFNDLAGSMMQGMRGQGGGGMGRGQGGWGSGNGITTSWMAGLNGQTYLFNDKMDLQGNYLYNGSGKYVEEKSSKTTYLEDGSQLIYNNGVSSPGQSYTDTWGHRIGARVEHKFSENTSILFQPQFNWGGGSFLEAEDFETKKVVDGAESMVSDGFTRNLGSSKNWRTNGFFLFRQRLGIPGRTLSFNARYNFQNTDMQGYNQSSTNSYSESTVESVNQRYDQNQRQNSLSGRLTYTEPLGRGFYIEANYELSWGLNKSWKNTYDAAGGGIPEFFPAGGDAALAFDRAYSMGQYVPADPESLNDLYSNTILNHSISHRAGANFMYQQDNIRAQVGAAFLPTTTHNETTGYDAYDRTVYNWAPQAMLWYDFAENSNVRLFYFGRSQQPSTSQLMPVLDNSNPLSVSLGNPYLDPYFNHGLRSEFRYTNKKTFLTLNVNLDGNINQSPIVNATWYDMSTGAQYSMPVNGKTSGNVNLRVSLNTPIAKSNFSIFSMTTGGYTNGSSYLGSSTGFNMSDYENTDGSFNYDKFRSDVPDIDSDSRFSRNVIQSVNAMQRLRLTYRNDFVELTAGGRTRMSKSWYTISSASTNTTWNNQVTGSMNWTIPGDWGIVADARYNWYRGYTTDQPSDVIINAEINKLLFKKSLTVAIKVYDLLNQAKNLTVTDESNYHMETYNNTLGRYVILSLTWRFGNFGNMRNARGPMGGGRPPRM